MKIGWRDMWSDRVTEDCQVSAARDVIAFGPKAGCSMCGIVATAYRDQRFCGRTTTLQRNSKSSLGKVHVIIALSCSHFPRSSLVITPILHTPVRGHVRGVRHVNLRVACSSRNSARRLIASSLNAPAGQLSIPDRVHSMRLTA